MNHAVMQIPQAVADYGLSHLSLAFDAVGASVQYGCTHCNVLFPEAFLLQAAIPNCDINGIHAFLKIERPAYTLAESYIQTMFHKEGTIDSTIVIRQVVQTPSKNSGKIQNPLNHPRPTQE